ncbi:breast cancer type 2 susceptibility protein homolog [Drosophila grimshawi]|uniref:breast cancer type 2 susceptibility protein homolog n=1 Tax=Drosophila grimshawi TaxID=7222 RepID=UPI000C86E6F5|nr:breast cancer type 2 susceptibility protein homolog [Drosophila grimshawi]XP_032591556.1 breast cancer type 2 susceptibility protein homolog [Drosophila grimshawi]
MEDDDDDYSIDASPTDPSGSYSNRSQRSRGRITCTKTKPATETQLQCEIVNLGELENCFDLREAQLFEADRLDCLRARQEPARERLVPASQDFQTLQSLLENDQIPMEKTEPEADYEIATQLLSTPLSVVQEILQDFCGSPSYVEVELPTYYDALPWFRFRDKHIKTFARRSATTASTAAITTVTDDDDRSSCSSELSIQEDFTTQVPTATHCAFDANSSQKICENLLNLSAFFTQKNNANLSIDLPEMQTELKDCTLMELKEYDELDDATDVLEDIGYFVGKAEQCKYVDDNCDNKTIDNAEFSLFSERTRILTTDIQSTDKDAQLCGDWFDGDFDSQKLTKKDAKEKSQKRETTKASIHLLEGIPLSEWQPIDIADSPKKINIKTELESDCNQLEMVTFSEWQPMDIPDAIEFRTVSDKTIQVSEVNQQDAAKLMTDLMESHSQKQQEARNDRNPHSEFAENIEFRTASNKTVKLTEEMRKKAAILMANLEADTANPQDCHQLNINCGFRTASNKTIEVTEAMQKSAAKLMADLEINNQLKREADASDCEMLEGIPFSEWQPMDVPNSLNHEDVEANQLDMILFNEWQPMSDSDDVAFRTASNKAIAISEEKLAEAAKLMADVEASYSQKLREDRHEGDPHSDISGNTEFRTASNKTMKLTEEMRKKAAMLMADLETNCNQLDKIQLKECPAESAECRTASNKTIQITDEKKKAGEKLMAEIEASYSKQLREDRNDGITHSDISGNIEFRTASNKVMEITEEMRKKAAMLMADLETNCNQLDEIHLKQIPPQNISECVQVTKEVVEETVKIVMSDVEAVIPEPPSEANNEITSCARISKDMQKVYEVTATPHQPQTSILEVPFETPKCTPEMESSLTQLTERSPLDRATKSSIITRRNLLSLNKRRKLKRDSEHCSTDASHTPIRLRFTPMAASTSTPVPNRKEDIKEVSQSQRTGRDRSCSQDSPRVAIARVGKRRSEDVLSPIYAPANKTRRLGLSRIRNKSSQDI